MGAVVERGETGGAAEGDSMKPPFCKSVATSGKSFVDDKSYIAASHGEMEGKLVWAEKYNGFTGTGMKPSKGECNHWCLVLVATRRRTSCQITAGAKKTGSSYSRSHELLSHRKKTVKPNFWSVRLFPSRSEW